MIALLEFWELIVGALGLAAALFFRWQAKRATDRANVAEGYAKTRKEIDDAMGDIPRDADSARDWLRSRRKP
jgi:hypothetical protein